MNAGEVQRSRGRLLAGWAVAFVTILLYLRVLGADFVYDGRALVLLNDFVHHAGNLADILSLHVMRMDVQNNNRPAYLAAAIVNWWFWGANAMGHHFASVVWHAAAGVLLFTFCDRLAGNRPRWLTFLAALFFAVHPVNCEPVAEVSYLSTIMAAAFILVALNLATFFEPRLIGKNVALGVLCSLSLFLAATAKETGVAGPPLLIAYWLLFRREERRPGWIALCAGGSIAVGSFLIARFTIIQPSILFPQ